MDTASDLLAGSQHAETRYDGHELCGTRTAHALSTVVIGNGSSFLAHPGMGEERRWRWERRRKWLFLEAGPYLTIISFVEH